jgi:hypothetical protein
MRARVTAVQASSNRRSLAALSTAATRCSRSTISSPISDRVARRAMLVRRVCGQRCRSACLRGIGVIFEHGFRGEAESSELMTQPEPPCRGGSASRHLRVLLGRAAPAPGGSPHPVGRNHPPSWPGPGPREATPRARRALARRGKTKPMSAKSADRPRRVAFQAAGRLLRPERRTTAPFLPRQGVGRPCSL